MLKVGLWVSNPTYLLICNTIQGTFLDLRNSPKLMEECSLVILDETFSTEDHSEYLPLIDKAVVLMSNSTTSVARSLLKADSLFDMISKRDFVLLEKILQEFYREEVQYLRIETATSVSLIKKEEIAYISYDRLLRRSVFTLINDETYFSKISLGELEEILTGEFLRVERGCIINKTRLKSINFKDELLLFTGGATLSLGRRTLKKMESLVFRDRPVLNI